MTFAPVQPQNPLYLYSDDGQTIGVQTTLTTSGFSGAQWFAQGQPGYSKPLSDMMPTGRSSTPPSYTVFTFDSNNAIRNLAIFMDRWQMAVDLWQPGNIEASIPHSVELRRCPFRLRRRTHCVTGALPRVIMPQLREVPSP